MTDELPEGWAQITLQEAGRWQSGGTPSRRKPEYFGGEVAWIKSGDLPDGHVLVTEETITQLGLRNSAAKVMPAGTISMALYGATIGKLGLMTFQSATNQACANVIPNDQLVETPYLFYFLLSERKKFIELGQGGAQPNISQEIVRNHPFRLAPLAEQRRIIEQLEKLLVEVEHCKERMAKIPVLLKRFRQSVLAAACSGRLTADWRETHYPVTDIDSTLESTFTHRTSAAKTARERQSLIELFEQTEEEDSDTLPEGWKYVSLNKICDSFDYGTSSKSLPTGAVPVLRMGNIQGGKIDWNNLVYTSDGNEIQKYSLHGQTVLFNRTNSPELVGKTAIYRGERPAIFAGYLIRINPLPELDPEYLNLCLNTSYAHEFCQQVKTDGVSQSNINAKKLGRFEIPFCSLEEQQEIVRRAGKLLALADRIEERYQGAKKQVDGLTQSILAKAFRGELVPTEAELAEAEGRSFESAEELLARIKRPDAVAQQSALKRFSGRGHE